MILILLLFLFKHFTLKRVNCKNFIINTHNLISHGLIHKNKVLLTKNKNREK